MTTTSCSLLLLLLSLAELESGPLGIACDLGNGDTCDRPDIRWETEDNDDNWGDANTDIDITSNASREAKGDNNDKEDKERLEEEEEEEVLLPTNWLELLADMLNSEAVKRLEEHSVTPITGQEEDNIEWVEPFTLENIDNIMEDQNTPNYLKDINKDAVFRAQKVMLEKRRDANEDINEISTNDDEKMMRPTASQVSEKVDEEKLLPLMWLDNEDTITPEVREKRSIVDFDLDPKHQWMLIEGLQMGPKNRVTNADSKKRNPRERRDIRRRLQLEQLLDELWPLTENMDEEDIVDVFVDYFDDVLENLENEATDTLQKRKRRRRSLLTTELDMTKPMEIIYPASERSNREHVVDLDRAPTHRMATDDAKLDVSLTKRDVKDITRDSDLAQILQWLKALSEGRESEVTAALMVAKKSKDSDQRMEPVFRTTTTTARNVNLKNDDLSLTLATTTSTTTSTTSSSRSTRETTSTTEESIETTTTEERVETTATAEKTRRRSTTTESTTTTTAGTTTESDRRRARFAEQTFELTTAEVPESLRSTDQLDIGMDEHSEHHHRRHKESKHKKRHKHRHKHKHHSHKEKHEQ